MSGDKKAIVIIAVVVGVVMLLGCCGVGAIALLQPRIFGPGQVYVDPPEVGDPDPLYPDSPPEAPVATSLVGTTWRFDNPPGGDPAYAVVMFQSASEVQFMDKLWDYRMEGDAIVMTSSSFSPNGSSGLNYNGSTEITYRLSFPDSSTMVWTDPGTADSMTLRRTQ